MLAPHKQAHFCDYAARVDWTAAEIRRRRLDRGLTQAQLARALGVSTSVVTKWENGQREPRAINIRALERILGDTPPRPDVQDYTSKTELELVAILHAVTAELTRRIADHDDDTPRPKLPPENLTFPRVVDLPPGREEDDPEAGNA